MQKNVVEDYINFVEKNFKQYLKLIFLSKNDEIIAKEYIRSYINVRYYNYECDEKEPSLEKRIKKRLKEKAKELLEKYPKKEEIIKEMLIVFQYFIGFDRVKKMQPKTAVVDLNKKRVNQFFVDTGEFFEKPFYDAVKDNIAQQDLYLKSFESKDFILSVMPVENYKHLFLTNLEYGYKFPSLYSDEIIEESLNAPFLKEDLLKIKYIMLSVIYLKEAILGKFSNKYIADFSYELIDKKNKVRQQLKFISDLVSQDKTFLKIPSRVHFSNKESVYELMREGYQFAIEIDEKFKISQANIKELNLFQCILISPNSQNYEQVKKVAKERNYKLIEI